MYLIGCFVWFAGGSIANMYGLMLGRYHRFPEVKTDGMQALPRLVVFTSAHVSDEYKHGLTEPKTRTHVPLIQPGWECGVALASSSLVALVDPYKTCCQLLPGY